MSRDSPVRRMSVIEYIKWKKRGKTAMDRVEMLKMNAKEYGLLAQMGQCSEECAELIQAINKISRASGYGQPTEKDFSTCMENLIEEMADVQIMIFQVSYLLGVAGEIDEIIDKKIDRQYKRMLEKRKEREEDEKVQEGEPDNQKVHKDSVLHSILDNLRKRLACNRHEQQQERSEGRTGAEEY